MTPDVSQNRTADVVVMGGGLIGLTIALEMIDRGARVLVVEQGTALREASIAAAGMLAVDDPHNPPQLLELARRSALLYPAFLDRLARRSGVAVPFQTEGTVQYRQDERPQWLAERSIDPRQLAAAVRGCIASEERSGRLTLWEQAREVQIARQMTALSVTAASGKTARAPAIVYATGAWAFDEVLTKRGQGTPLVVPAKGQMLRVVMPASCELAEVHRSQDVYVVPRTQGPQAGTALIGATVEEAGFDKTVLSAALQGLRERAAGLSDDLKWATAAPEVESWAGLRPATPDGLPLLGRLAREPQEAAGTELIATGHFRNGILLAPATAEAIGDLLEGKPSAIDLLPFAADRFDPQRRGTHTGDGIRAAMHDKPLQRLG